MKLEELKQVVEWAIEGKLQWNRGDKWVDSKADGIAVGVDFNAYRRKPEPELRPWKPEEVPVGALFRTKRQPSLVSLILMKWDFGFTYSDASRIHQISFDAASDIGEHSTDGGKTWKPCGVEEGV